MSALFDNTKKFGTDEEYKRLQDILNVSLKDLIRATTEKTKKFMKADGSFGCTWDASPHTTGGVPGHR